MGREGSGVRAVSKSTVEISFTFKGMRCRERIKIKPSPANLKRAKRHRAAIMDAIERGNFDYAVTFPDSPRAKALAEIPDDVHETRYYLSYWLHQKKENISASTYRDYFKTISNILIPAFGHFPLSAIRRKDWTMIARIYGKWMPDANPDCGNRAVDLYGNPDRSDDLTNRKGKTGE